MSAAAAFIYSASALLKQLGRGLAPEAQRRESTGTLIATCDLAHARTTTSFAATYLIVDAISRAARLDESGVGFLYTSASTAG